ncbi:hypothetical protein ZWY2020_008720 [Hordeum vulgare]|nr:hypothetical protein ZWY2020_008720 [Hordeum vulgare]
MVETVAFPPLLRAPALPPPASKTVRHQPPVHSPLRLFSPTSLLSSSHPTPTSSSRTPRIGRRHDPTRQGGGGGQPWNLPPSLSLPARRALLSLLSDPDSARDILSALPTSELASVLNALASRGRPAVALAALHAARDLHGEHVLQHPRVLPAAVRVLARAGRLADASALLDAAPEPDASAYTALVSAFSRASRFRDAVAVFRRMVANGIQPAIVTYNVVLHVYSKIAVPWKDVVALVDSMKNDGIPLDRYTYNTLISCCRRGALYKEAAKVFDEMRAAGFEPDKVTFNSLLDVYGKARMHDEAIGVLKEMELGGCPPSVVTYNSLISSYVKDGLLKEAAELKEEMEVKGIQPDVITYTTLISGLDRAGKIDAAIGTYDEMLRNGCKPNLCTYNALIKLHGVRGKFPEMMAVFDDLRSAGFVPDVVTWNTLLAVFGQNGLDSEVSGVFKEMKKSGYVPERDTYVSLISSYSRCGLFDQSMEIYKRMIEAGIYPDISTYNAVLSALARGGRWEQAEKLFAEMENLDCRPDELSYSSLLHAYANAKKLDKMKALSEDIYAEKIESHHGLVKTLVLVNSKVNNLSETEKAFLELGRRRCSLDINVLNAMVSVYGKNRMVKKVEEILSLMKGSSINLSTATYNSLMHMYRISLMAAGEGSVVEMIFGDVAQRLVGPKLYSKGSSAFVELEAGCSNAISTVDKMLPLGAEAAGEPKKGPANC